MMSLVGGQAGRDWLSWVQGSDTGLAGTGGHKETLWGQI